MKFAIRITAFLLSLIFCIGALSGCARVGNPLHYLKERAEQNIRDSLCGELLGFVIQTVQNGSLQLNFDGTDLVDGLPESAELQLFLDTETRRLAASGNMVLDGGKYDAELWVNQQSAVLTSPSFLGSYTLGIDFQTFENDLKTSIFANNSGTAYARPEVTPNTAGAVIDFKNGVFDLLAAYESTSALADEAVECFFEKLTDNAYNNRYREDGHTYVTLSVDNDALSRALRETRAELVENRSFCRELRTLAKTMDAIRTSKEGVASNEYTTKLEYFLTSEDDIEKLCLKIDSAPAFSVDLSASVRNFGGLLETLKIAYTKDGQAILDLALQRSESDDSGSISVTYLGVCRELTYKETKDSFKQFAAQFCYKKSVYGTDVVELVADLEADRRADRFTCTLTKGEQTRIFSGNYSFDETELSFGIDKVNVNGEDRRFSLSVVLSQKEAMPDVPSYTNIVRMESSRYTPIYERTLETKEALESALQKKPQSPYTVLSEILTVLGLEEEIPSIPDGEQE